jgi:magnesium-transporting ATPase (P-type)
MKATIDEPKPAAAKPAPGASKTTTPSAKSAAKPEPKDDLKTLPMAEVEKRLGSSPAGLTQAEAQKRLTQYGPNEIEEKKTNLILKFLSYFWGPIPWMIEIAVILSGVVRHWPDFFIILLLLVANAVVGFWEERQAGNAIDALKARLAIKARVNGTENGSTRRPRNWCRVTPSGFGWVTSCRPTPGCWTAMRCQSTSPR